MFIKYLSNTLYIYIGIILINTLINLLLLIGMDGFSSLFINIDIWDDHFYF